MITSELTIHGVSRAYAKIVPPTLAATDLLPLLRKIEAREMLVTAHKVLRASGQVFRYGIAIGRCERNPAADLRSALKAPPRPKHMAALSASELPTFLRKVEAYDGEVQTKLAMRLLALTFVLTSCAVPPGRKSIWTRLSCVRDAGVGRRPRHASRQPGGRRAAQQAR